MKDIQQAIGYPRLARDKKIQGDIVIRVLVDKNGRVIRHKIISNTHYILHNAVLSCIYDLKFTSAIQCGEKIKFWVNIPFNFKILP